MLYMLKIKRTGPHLRPPHILLHRPDDIFTAFSAEDFTTGFQRSPAGFQRGPAPNSRNARGVAEPANDQN